MGGATIYAFHPVREETKGKPIIYTMQDQSGPETGEYFRGDRPDTWLNPLQVCQKTVVFICRVPECAIRTGHSLKKVYISGIVSTS